MAKFFGKIGYTAESIETAPGVWVEQIVERSYYGDVVQSIRKLDEGEGLNKDLSVQNSISIVADAFANEHIFAIRYIIWAGTPWTIQTVEVRSPRLLLRLGVLYNGPLAVPVSP